jgi:hypothetical protein
MPHEREHPVVSSARREALVVAAIFVVSLLYTVIYCYVFGYHRSPETLTFVWGFPDWVFWGILLPWIICLGLSFWFGHTFVHDADLGPGDEIADDDLEGEHD